MSGRQVTFGANEQTPNDYRSYKQYQQSGNTSFKITVASQDNRKEQQRKSRPNKTDAYASPQPQASHTQKSNNADAAVRNIKELSSKHLESLRHTFNKTINEQILSKSEHEQYLSVYNQIQKTILDKQPDAQVVLYGSTLFECALKGTSMVDIDVQFNNTLPYDTLKQLVNIIRSSDLYKEVQLNVDDELAFIDVTLSNSNIRIRLTSNNISAVQLSRIIQLYTKFDKRVLPLLRLFRIFSKICYLDQRDEGTLHPIALHVMVIYFLQQLNPSVLPCLHECIFGIDKAPVTLINEQYNEFFQVCNESINRWNTANVATVEMLFLQLLSYFSRRFHMKRFEMSIKTRMPLLRNAKQPVNNRSMFCADPIYINRNLCYSLRVGYSINYFYHILETALNYFCEIPKSDQSYYAIANYDETTLRKHLVELIHKSYQLLIDYFPNRNDFWNKIKQEELRQQYKKSFNPISEPILKLKEGHTIPLLDAVGGSDDDEGVEDDDTENSEEISRENTNEQMVPNQEEKHQVQVVVKQTPVQETQEPLSFNTLAQHLDEKQKLILRQQYNEQVRLFNEKMQELLTEIAPVELFYDMQASNFDVEKLPASCSICFRMNHKKSNCPELSLPRLVNIPKVNRQWAELLTRICKQVTDQCKPQKEDTDIREEIVEYLKSELTKCYPECCVHIYGSSQNGFGFRQSDLDVCLELKENEESNTIIFEKLVQSLLLKPDFLKEIEFVRDARVPIVRSKHSKFNIEIDISLNNTLAVENTRLLKTYAQIDPRVSELGYMIKHLVKLCQIGDVRTGTLSSYAYILMLIHFLQQFRPSVLPVLQQLDADKNEKKVVLNEWNVYFYDDLSKLKQVWINKNGSNTMSTGELWIEFLRYYTERFDYKNHIVTIRQIEPLRRDEKGWFHPTIAIEDPFILTHNLANRLPLKKWAKIQRIFIRAREGFSLTPTEFNLQQTPIDSIQDYLFDVDYLCQDKSKQFNRKPKNKQKQKPQEVQQKTSTTLQ